MSPERKGDGGKMGGGKGRGKGKKMIKKKPKKTVFRNNFVKESDSA
jgi:hypothetical protein